MKETECLEELSWGTYNIFVIYTPSVRKNALLFLKSEFAMSAQQNARNAQIKSKFC
jgi:hypothetical protein